LEDFYSRTCCSIVSQGRSKQGNTGWQDCVTYCVHRKLRQRTKMSLIYVMSCHSPIHSTVTLQKTMCQRWTSKSSMIQWPQLHEICGRSHCSSYSASRQHGDVPQAGVVADRANDQDCRGKAQDIQLSSAAHTVAAPVRQ
jgi:hypothetical protein